MGIRDLLFLGVVLGGAGVLGAGLLRSTKTPVNMSSSKVTPARDAEFDTLVNQINTAMRRKNAELDLKPAPVADELTVMRRLALALMGSIPSLEEIRRFESRPTGQRVEAWLDDLFRDRRTADYLAERFARACVGTEDGPFLLFRRRRFTTWLSDAFMENRRYDAIVRDMIADEGLWTDHPATNFVSVTFDNDRGLPDPDRLGARVARAFLGVRLDCAQCHDHPFQPWKQEDFRGLAAFFGGVHANLRGIHDGAGDYAPPDRKTNEPVKVRQRAPFLPELLPNVGTPRQQLAAWVVDPRNANFSLATANRVWALMFGKPLSEPVDDLPVNGDLHPVLPLLASDFATHGYNLRRLIRAIAATDAFRSDSAADPAIGDLAAKYDDGWAAFPMTRLRPEQVAGAVYQSASLTTLGAQSSWIVRLGVSTGRNEFVRRYGDTGEDEFNTRGGTIPQRLLLMNGDLVGSKTKNELFNTSSLLAQLSSSDAKAVEVAYLTVLTRRPTPVEAEHFAKKLAGKVGDARKEQMSDLHWTLLNATEFSWNH